jgi:type II secretory pathway component PulF
MKAADLAFVNRQLALMTTGGHALEVALRKLCQDLPSGRLRSELDQLERDLAQGTPLAEAVKSRDLPPFCRQMLKLGAQSNDLPGVLLRMADHYERLATVWEMMKTVTFYPLLVLLAACAVSFTLARIIDQIRAIMVPDLFATAEAVPAIIPLNWLPVFILPLLFAAIAGFTWIRPLRDRLQWRLPVVRDQALAHFAASLGLLLRQGCALGDAVRYLAEMEGRSVLGRELREWSRRIESGDLVFSALGERSRLIPPLFVWLVEQQARDLPGGLAHAAAHYTARAERRFRFWREAAAPVGLVSLGLMIGLQVYPVFWWLRMWFESILLI